MKHTKVNEKLMKSLLKSNWAIIVMFLQFYEELLTPKTVLKVFRDRVVPQDEAHQSKRKVNEKFIKIELGDNRNVFTIL